MTPKEALEKAVQAAGGTRAGLARLLDITMQAVNQWEQAPARRVLDIERLTGVSRHDLCPDIYPRETAPAEMAETKTAWRSEPSCSDTFARIRVRPDGSAVVPGPLLEAAGFRKDGSFTAHVTGAGEVRLLTGDAAIRYARELVRQFVPENVSLVDELIEERRREAQKFEGELAKKQDE